MSFGVNMQLKEIYLNWRRRVLSRSIRKKVNLNDISIISMNCIGGIVYHDCQQEFLSPTINLFFLPSDFIKFVNNLEYYLSLTPNITMGAEYPIGELDDIKVYFMHYSSCKEALEKWEKRKKRINFEKIFIIMVERDGFSKEDFENFKKIKYPKILFTKSKEYMCDSSFYMKKYKKMTQLPDIIPGRYCYKSNVLANRLNFYDQ